MQKVGLVRCKGRSHSATGCTQLTRLLVEGPPAPVFCCRQDQLDCGLPAPCSAPSSSCCFLAAVMPPTSFQLGVPCQASDQKKLHVLSKCCTVPLRTPGLSTHTAANVLQFTTTRCVVATRSLSIDKATQLTNNKRAKAR